MYLNTHTLFRIFAPFFLVPCDRILSLILADALEINQEHLLDVIVHTFYQNSIQFKPNNFFFRNPGGRGGLLSWKSRQEGGSCASGNPGERGG